MENRAQINQLLNIEGHREDLLWNMTARNSPLNKWHVNVDRSARSTRGVYAQCQSAVMTRTMHGQLKIQNKTVEVKEREGERDTHELSARTCGRLLRHQRAPKKRNVEEESFPMPEIRRETPAGIHR